ncbi:putative aminoglycoside phosphotransferase [Legionella erythra]|uniref:Putative aminoglycoside phosphotransferase n=2 Tax=Legionella erythra TaxID=448 RepID=A0A0W0TGG3_LEGER|nr:putative aminoglycoside phosphotransferase [Legionella erythra]
MPFLHEAIVRVTPLSQGLQHHNDLLCLQDGSLWVAKLFAPTTWLGITQRDHLEFTEQFATVAANRLALSLPAFCPNPPHFFIPVGQQLGLIKPYCPGEIHERLSYGRAEVLGTALATIHQLGFKHPRAKPFPAITGIDTSGLPWITPLIEQCNQHRHYRSHEWVIGHRDLHSHNIIWQDNNRPCFLDWESAGLIHPAIELLGLALNCAGVVENQFDDALFSATLHGYFKTVPYRFKTDDTLWQLIFHSWLLWYAYCLKQGKQQDAAAMLTTLAHLRELVPTLKAIYSKTSES